MDPPRLITLPQLHTRPFDQLRDDHMQRMHAFRTSPRLLAPGAVCVVFLTILTPSAIGRISGQAAGHAPVKVGRVGGHVHRAWPDRGRAPGKALTRWIARQVGPTRARPCRRRVGKRLIACQRHRISTRASGAAMANGAAIAGAGPGFQFSR
jgi:hypothetical protein